VTVKVRGIVWMGVQTTRFDEMSALLRALMGAPPGVVEDGFNLWALPNGDLVELFADGSKPSFGDGPVVGFLVDDIEASTRDVEAAGAEVVGGYGPNEDGYRSVHVRGPDGNVYELVHDPHHATRAGLPS
jgi:catechol 2,3-dioxygenase-like lactoylglutathione lyase family enzyme